MKHLPNLVFFALLLLAGLPSMSSAQLPAVVTELVEKLGDKQYKVRQQAEKDLLARTEKDSGLAGPLRALLGTKTDPEIRLRLQKILATLPIKEWRFSKTAVANNVWELDPHGAAKFDFLDQHTLRIDTTQSAKDYLRLRLRLPVTNEVHRVVMSFELKVEEQALDHLTHSGVMATIEDDRHQAWAFFWRWKIASLVRPHFINHDFTKDFVAVRMETVGELYRVYLDGKKVLEIPFGNYHMQPKPRSWAVFGDSTGLSSGISVWRNVRVQLYER